MKKSRLYSLLSFLTLTLICLYFVGILLSDRRSIDQPIKLPIDQPMRLPTENNKIGSPVNRNDIIIDSKNKYLPHKGLFVRRNNEFGTKIDLGIKKIINEGILVDQKMIRFDDFVVASNEQVPLPKLNDSLAVNYGLIEIPKNAKRNPKSTHYLAIALRAVDTVPVDKKTQTPPVNYIFAIDTSGSMEGEKLDTVKTSIREIIKGMRKNDVIGIIGFNDKPKTFLRATPVEKIKVDELSKLFSSMIADGGTDINLGLSFGIDEISRYANEDRLNHVYLFSDGNPTSGETDWIKIRQKLATKTRGGIHVSTFAFGSDANIRELDALAGSASGKYTFVTDSSSIKFSIGDELNRRERLAAINTQISVEIDPDVLIMHLYGHDEITDRVSREAVLKDLESTEKKAKNQYGVNSAPDIITKDKGIRVFVPDLAVGETYWIVFELGIPNGKSSASIGRATIQYVNTIARSNKQNQIELTPKGNLPNSLVVKQALGLRTSEVAFYALDDLYQQDLGTAENRLQNHVSLLGSINADLQSETISDDIVTLKKFISLAQNLGKPTSTSDSSSQGSHVLHYGLNTFGRVRNGLNQLETVSKPK
jgi:uncharacterized protein YegL